MRSLSLLVHMLALPQAVLSLAVYSHPLTVNLSGYGSFIGTQLTTNINNQVLASSVDAWLGVDYATQPVGENRFRPVSWPAPFNGVKNATSYSPVCIQDPQATSYPQSEACLTLNVYRPSGIPLDQKLPVLVWTHGGSFTSGNGRSLDGAAFVAASKIPVMVVTFQYRLGPLGSLPSQLFQDEGLLNLNVRDQHHLLHFVQRYIASFSGDPEAVTLGGQSAGAHSVGIHYTHNYGEDAGKPLFARVLMASGSVTARSFPNATYPLYQRQFAQFMSGVGCPTEDDEAALDCLRTINTSTIQTVGTSLFNAYNYNLTWPFQPVSNAPLLETLGSIIGIAGEFFHLPVLTSRVNDEGRGFVPTNLSTEVQVESFAENLAPGLTQDDLAQLDALYPDPATHPDSPYANSTNSTEFFRVAAAYGDYAYICPVQETAYRVSKVGVPVYKARFNAPNKTPAWLGVPHSSDVGYLTGLPGNQYPEITDIYHAYVASFVATGDPNVYKAENAPQWERYEPGDDERMQLVVQPGNGTGMERDVIRSEQCAYWRDPERMLRLYK